MECPIAPSQGLCILARLPAPEPAALGPATAWWRLDTIPYGGFSSVRLEGWHIRRDLPESVNQLKPAPGMRWSAIGLSSPFVHRVVTTVALLCVGPRTR